MLNKEDRTTCEEDRYAIPKLLGAKEVGEILGVSSRTVNRLVRNSELGYVRVSTRKRRFTIAQVEQFVSANTFHRDWALDEEC